jgi:hypothetical protein
MGDGRATALCLARFKASDASMIPNQQSTAGDRLAWLVAGAAGLLAFLFYLTITANIFVLSEARTYTVHGGWIDSIRASTYFLFPEGVNTRYTSMFFSALTRQICGVSVFCMNWFQSALLGLCALLSVVHAWQITRRWTIAIGAFAIWMLSGPALNAALWQSIQHDKLAMVMILLTLVVTHVAIVRPRTGPVSMALAFAIVMLTAVAFNAKEVAFLLPFASAAMVGHLWSSRHGFAWRRALALLLPQFAYAAWYIVTYFANMKSEWASHTMKGSLLKGALMLSEHALNLGNFMGLGSWGSGNARLRSLAEAGFAMAAAILLLLAGVALVRQYLPALRKGRTALVELLREDSALAYFILITTIVVAGSARTAFPSAFYLLLAMWSAGAALLLLLCRLSRSFVWHRAAFGALVIVTLLPYMLSYAAHFVPGGVVPRGLETSKRLRDSFAAIAAMVDGTQVRTLRFVLAGDADFEYYYFTGHVPGATDQDLGPYVFQSQAVRPKVELVKLESNALEEVDPSITKRWRALMEREHATAASAVPEQTGGELNVFLDRNYTLRRVLLDGADVFAKSR